jgi:glycosyltransferase involved in cell wall biosynthesis
MHLTHICPRFKEIHGGGEPVLFHLFHELCDLGFKNTIYTYNYPNSMLPLLDSRVELKGLPRIFNRSFENVLLSGFYDLFCSIFLTIRAFRDTDVVCFHTENVIPALLSYKLAGGSKPTLYFCFQPPRFAYDTTKETACAGGTVGLLVPILKAIYRPFDRLTVRLAGKVATFSTGYKQWIECIYNVSDVKVLPPGVEKPQNITPLPKNIAKKLSKLGSKSLLFVGKLVTWKNIDRLINVTAIVREQLPDIRLLIVGDGPCMDSLKRQTTDMGLDNNVIFSGYVSAKNVFSYCAVADLFVLLEKNVSFGLSLIEANAMGLPAMAFQGGGPNDIIEEERNGFLLPVDMTDKGIAERIIGYLSDEKKIQSMKGHAFAVSRKFTWRRFGEAFAEVVKDLTS